MESKKSMKSDIISEIITVYRKMKRGKNNQNTYRMLLNVASGRTTQVYDCSGFGKSDERKLDFYTFREFKRFKYMYFSSDTSLMQWNRYADELEHLLNSRYYWINIFNPCEKDLEVLATRFSVHDATLMEIREKNTEEKIEMFKNYTFISMKLFNSCKLDTEDIDFNILVFKDKIITTHDKPWSGILDIVNFLSLISQNTTLHPSWVLYSIIVEFLQDVKYILEGIKPETTAKRALSRSITYEMGDVLYENFDTVYQIYNFRQFIKPKIGILREFRKCKRHLNKKLANLLDACYYDFKLQEKQTREYNMMLERSQDLFLALVDMEQSREANQMNKCMKRFTQINLIFLPLQAIAGLWGMNVKVPWQDRDSTMYFWILLTSGPVINLLYCFLTHHGDAREKKGMFPK